MDLRALDGEGVLTLPSLDGTLHSLVQMHLKNTGFFFFMLH